jgi:hypothetical protein
VKLIVTAPKEFGRSKIRCRAAPQRELVGRGAVAKNIRAKGPAAEATASAADVLEQ